MDQPGKVAKAACGQLNRENEYFSFPVRALEFSLERCGFGRLVRRQPGRSLLYSGNTNETRLSPFGYVFSNGTRSSAQPILGDAQKV